MPGFSTRYVYMSLKTMYVPSCWILLQLLKHCIRQHCYRQWTQLLPGYSTLAPTSGWCRERGLRWILERAPRTMGRAPRLRSGQNAEWTDSSLGTLILPNRAQNQKNAIECLCLKHKALENAMECSCRPTTMPILVFIFKPFLPMTKVSIDKLAHYKNPSQRMNGWF